jgi:uncharacterized integral membrane protein (TIGR00697 family)
MLPILPFHTFELSVGAILYPLTFLIADLMAEFYGKKSAKFCVRFSIVINVTVAMVLLLMDFLPATTWSKMDNSTFHQVFGLYGVAAISSMIACYISQSIDISLYLWIRKITNGKHLWLRSNGSTMVSLLIDTLIIIGLMVAFGVFPKEHMWSLIGNSYAWKLFFTACSTPFFYGCVSFIRFISSKEVFVTQV